VNRNHAIALALVGWYLMIPPTQWEFSHCETWGKAETFTVPRDVDCPEIKRAHHETWPIGGGAVRYWNVVDSFDTLTDCKTARDKTSQGAPIHSVQARAQCVATDDPRLK
jgi:hypothetical protein